MTGMGLDDPSENKFSDAFGVRTLVALLLAGRDWFWAYRVIAEIDHRVLATRIGCPTIINGRATRSPLIRNARFRR